MVDDVSQSTLFDRRDYVSGAVAPGVSQRSATNPAAASDEFAALARKADIQAVEEQTSATQRFLDPASKPASIQSLEKADQEAITGRDDAQRLSPAEAEAQRIAEAERGRPGAGRPERDVDAEEQSDARGEELLRGAVDGSNLVEAQEAASATQSESFVVGDNAPSPAEQLYGTDAYREATLSFQRPSGADRLTALFGGGEFAQAGASTAPNPDEAAAPTAANDAELDADTAANDDAPFDQSPDIPGAVGVAPQPGDDETTTITSGRDQLDANNDQRQSALNAYEALQQLRSLGNVGIMV